MADSKKQVFTIGIPRAFYYYTHPGLWEAFFQNLGFKTLLSEKSGEKILRNAVPHTESEHCLAHKLFDGHLLSLLGKADAVFIPRLLSLTKKHICCAKFAALPEAAQCGIARGTPVITVDIDENKEPLLKTLIRLGKNLGKPARLAKNAAENAIQTMHEEWKKQQAAMTAEKPFLLLGHPYTLHDAFIGEPVKQKLKRMGHAFETPVFTHEKLPESVTRWCTFGRMHRLITEMPLEKYAGAIQISTFNCGPDSVMLEFYRAVCRSRGIPYLVLMIDEHTGNAGMETRLEAFADSIQWKRV
ncbi:MAG: acyl-CoA dehydratase activase-related protein [Fibrobacter sp.]|jgi:predicted nucleotide-binding protein (sugar kinase/HSP70/actin superfamily)|nr:acyl-CoA dehydratase activase-related protein [Fibrobacter sp.]